MRSHDSAIRSEFAFCSLTPESDHDDRLIDEPLDASSSIEEV
jgi:hypothetical protein